MFVAFVANQGKSKKEWPLALASSKHLETKQKIQLYWIKSTVCDFFQENFKLNKVRLTLVAILSEFNIKDKLSCSENCIVQLMAVQLKRQTEIQPFLQSKTNHLSIPSAIWINTLSKASNSSKKWIAR